MPIVNTVAVRLEAFEAGFRQGIDAANAKLAAFEKQLGNTSDAFEKINGRAANFADGMRALRKPIKEPQSLLDKLTAGVKRFGETTQAGKTPLASFIQQNRNLGDVAQNAVKFIAGLNPVMAAVVAVAGVAAVAVGRLVQEITQLGSQLLVTAERTGRTVEDLSGLRVAATLSNTSIQDVQASIRFLNRLLAQASGGSSAAEKRFQALGVEFRNTEGKVKPLAQLMGEIGDRLSEVEDASERAGKAQLVYGFSAARAIPLLGQSAEAQARLTAEAKAYGGFISEDFARQADRFTNNNARIGFILEGLKIQIGGPIVKVLNVLAEALLRATLATKVFGEGADQALTRAALAFAKLTGNEENIKALEAELKTSQEAVKNLAGAWDNLGEQVEKGAGSLDDAGESLDEAARSAEELAGKLDPIAERFRSVIDSLTGKPEQAGAPFVAFAEELAALGGTKALAGLNALINQLDIPGTLLENTLAKLRELRAEVSRGIAGKALVRELNRLEVTAGTEANRRLLEREGPGILPAATTPLPFKVEPIKTLGGETVTEFPLPEVEPFREVETVLGTIKDLTEEEAEEVGRLNELASGFGDTLVDAALGAKGAFGDFFEGLAIQLAKAIARALVLASLLSLTGLGGGLKFGQLFKKGLNFDDPGADSFALAEGRRFGMLFGRGARVGSEGNRLGIAGNAIAQAPTVSPVTNVNVYEPGPLTNITFTDKAVIPRLRQRLRTLGEEPFTR